MAKIIVAKGDTVLQEMDLSKERVTIGRRLYNDVVINDLAISGEHAVIVTENGDSFLEDLNSTNGTQINGQPVRKHFLRDGDVIELAQYRISYAVYFDNHPKLGSSSHHRSSITKPEIALDSLRPRAFVKVISGPNSGKVRFLERSLTTLGMPGFYVVAIVWKENGYHIAQIEGDISILVNECPIGHDGRHMGCGDRIDLPGTVMEFSLLN